MNKSNNCYMDTIAQSKMKRQRGVVLTAVGLKRLLAAIQAVEIAENHGTHFTLEDLSERINVSNKTISRVWSLHSGVDQKTLRLCFSAFNLELRKEDYTILTELDETEAAELSALTAKQEPKDFPQSYPEDLVTWKQQADVLSLPYPDGPVGLDAAFYSERPPIEALAYRELTQPGCVIRIRAPKAMGKSSLMLRILTFAEEQGYRTASLDGNQFDADSLTDVNKFLRSFCLRVAQELAVEPQLDDYWQEEVGSKLSCSFYFKNYLLRQIDSPVVLVLSEVDRFFEYSQLTAEFFPLLRSWYEEARRRGSNLQKLRLVVVYSTQEYVSLDINHSPFNIGLALHLPEFTPSQVQDLARRHRLDWSSTEVARLMALLGGHPFLVRIALYHICCRGIALEQLLQEAMHNGGIFHAHLWQLWMTLQTHPGLVEALGTVITAEQSINLNPMQAYQLESQGLICYEGDRVKPRCELYRAYFKQLLSTGQT